MDPGGGAGAAVCTMYMHEGGSPTQACIANQSLAPLPHPGVLCFDVPVNTTSPGSFNITTKSNCE